MSATTQAVPAPSTDESLTIHECRAMLQRSCFGHLAFARAFHVDVLPVRFAFVDNWLYFRANPELRAIIGHSPWLMLSITELRDSMHVDSVIVRGGCYETGRTGSTKSDAAALRGILQLRDRPQVGRASKARVWRTSTVYRLHVDDLRGTRTFVPCPAGERAYDDIELQHLRDAARDQTAGEDARADDDGMAEPNPETPPRSVR